MYIIVSKEALYIYILVCTEGISNKGDNVVYLAYL